MSIEMTLPLGVALNPGQHRLCRIQIVNWGTFHGLHNLEIDRAGTLVTGHPGVGKSTLFDAMGHIFFATPKLNESANDAATRADRRTTFSYLRGRKFKTSSGTVYQRPGATWSAILLGYEDGLGNTVSIGAVFDLPDAGLENQVSKHYLLSEGALDIAELEHHGPRRFTVSSLSKSLEPTEAFDTHKAFIERVRRRLGVESDKAFALLRTLQNGKGLAKGVNQFFRHEVLEEPTTLKAAAAAVEDFAHLRGIYRQLDTARAQRDVLAQVPEQDQVYRTLAQRIGETEQLLNSDLQQLDAKVRQHILRNDLHRHQRELAELKEQEADILARKSRTEGQLQSLAAAHDSAGSASLMLLEREADAARKALSEKESALRALQEQATAAGLNFEFSATGLDELRGNAARTMQQLASITKDAQTVEYEAMASLMALRKRAEALDEQIRSYQRRGTNIDDRSVAARRAIASACSLSEEQLPFAGELMDVAADSAIWRLAAEKALRSLARTILVPGEFLTQVTHAIDELDGLGRVRWVDTSVKPREAEAGPADLVSKLDFASGEAGTWLRTKITADYPLACVENDAAMHVHPKAITPAGTIKSGAGSFERDTRSVPASDYLLGFTNESKISELQNKAERLKEQILKAQDAADERTAAKNQVVAKSQLLAAIVADERNFAQLDASAALDSLRRSEQKLGDALVLSGDSSKIRQQIENAKADSEQLVGDLALVRSRIDDLELQNERAQKVLATTEGEDANGNWVSAVPTHLRHHAILGPILEQVAAGDCPPVDSIGEAFAEVKVQLGGQLNDFSSQRHEVGGALSDTFKRFAREFGTSHAQTHGTTPEAAEHYAKLHGQIVADGLPHHEAQFREYFANRSYERFSDLLQLLDEERRMISERIKPLNQILADVTFEHGSMLRLEVENSIPVEAGTFRKELKAALNDAYTTKEESTLAKSYQALEALVSALSDPGLNAWRSTVLDVRQHVVISCNEHKPNGEVETGLEPGTLSGGEGQRFTSFIMGAALAYQLGFASAGFTSYGTVMIDEAFIQANSEYAAAGIRALQEFGFHLVLAAPEDKIDLSHHLGSIIDIIKHPGSNISGFVTTGRSPALATTITLRG
ncbi:chromosome segregation protein SMC [Arthrobacter sp. MYb229]|uniref:ATP-binding protein n=1 Tax=unclassified Arthrobacter TaxID=235627 RepID=UPI000CFCA766|nr:MULTISPECIES: ATP-binding protein [unclassified Arthrobacter]PRA00865.1 chromosome segregation protein SMC [Arthrobacter sp. MYb229]PRB48799.1 chromosome segregation protein SMC [Arthrobacter sp. MYb216]